ncbi:DUF305 domain-containing protein [Amycolatopsis sp. NPDC003861]
MLSSGSIGQWSVLLILAVVVLLLGATAGGLVTRRRPTTLPADDIERLRELQAQLHEGVQLARLGCTRSQDPGVRGIATAALDEEAEYLGRVNGWAQLWEIPAPEAESDDDSRWGVWFFPIVARLRRVPAGRFDVEFLQVMAEHWSDGVTLGDRIHDGTESTPLAGLARDLADRCDHHLNGTTVRHFTPGAH